MKRTKERNWRQKISAAALCMGLALFLGLFWEPFSMVSSAQSQGKVIASSANIRKNADAGSEIVGSAAQNASLTINNQVTASDNTVWYQVFVDADTLGYIRSDLVQITDGSTPPTAELQTGNAGTDSGNTGGAASNEGTAPQTNETPAEVTAVNPLSASVTGGESVRVRSNASTTSSIVAQAQNGLALTVTGQAAGSDGKVWYQVSFIANGKDVTGFIRSDYVALSGELTPLTEGTPDPGTETPPAEPEQPAEPEVTKDWETQYDSGKWYLNNNIEEKRYAIDDIFSTLDSLTEEYESASGKAKTQTVVIIILVILSVGLAGAVAYLIFKIKDMVDSAYFAEVEKETVRRRTADRPESRRVMHTVGSDKTGSARRPSGQGTARSAGARPGGSKPTGARSAGGSGAGTTGQGTARPAGARPAGGSGAGAPVQGTARPAGARPAGTPGTGTAVQGAARPGGGKPTGTRSAGGSGTGTAVQGAARPGGGKPAGTRSAGGSGARPSARPAETSVSEDAEQTRRPAPGAVHSGKAQNPGWKSRNFMTDDDEFEFEFLNWDGDEDQ